jgi:preprotein translocase subunit YajC
MPGLFEALPLVFAQNAPAAGAGGEASGNYTFVLMIAVVAFWFYLLMIRPQQKQEKERRAMIEAIKKNDRVITSAGIYGTVVSVDSDQDRVVVRVDDDRGVKLVFSKGSIARVLDAAAEKERAAESA